MNSSDARGASDPAGDSYPGGPPVVTDVQQLRERIWQQRKAGRRVGVVPTMGALHEGHLSLVREASRECDFTAVTIFVNPTQFAPGEDFSRYPRTLPQDLQALAPLQVDLVFAPPVEVMYPPGYSTYVDPPEVARRWEGACRPTHFRGVTTVVLKLFHLLPADRAYFGQKDYQQARVIQQMVRDLNVPIQIQICPTIRDPDGLALSSRNQYLTDEQRSRALSLSRGLELAERLVRDGHRDPEVVRARLRELILGAGVEQLEYVALVDPETLEEVVPIRLPMMVLLAARVGETRLIDNCRIEDRRIEDRRIEDRRIEDHRIEDHRIEQGG